MTQHIKLDWAGLALCTTVFLPCFASASEAPKQLSREEIFLKVIAKSGADLLKIQSDLQQKPDATLQKLINTSGSPQDFFPRKMDANDVNCLYNFMTDHYQPPELSERARKRLWSFAIADLAEKELVRRKNEATDTP